MTVELALIGMVAFAFALAGVLLLILFRMELRRQEEVVAVLQRLYQDQHSQRQSALRELRRQEEVVAVLQRLYQDQHSQRQSALRDLNQLWWTGQTESEPSGEEGR